MDESDVMEFSNSPPDRPISETVKEITLDLLPPKSKELYEKRYEELMVWCSGKGVKKVSQNLLLSYFSEKAKVMKSPSLWSLYSMLKATLKVKNDYDIRGFHKLRAFLKEQAVGYKPNKSRTFSQDNIRKFLLEAPDVYFLFKKVILIFGITGACRRDELVKMTTDGIEDKGSVLIVTVPDFKTYKSRVFLITNDDKSMPSVDYLAICRKYFRLRPVKATSNRLFLKYNKGICTNQAVGSNTIGKIPCDVAMYLGLPGPSQYTGHCFRRSSAKLKVNGRGIITQLKRQYAWKSLTEAGSNIDDSMGKKNATAQIILGNQNLATANSVESLHVNGAQKSCEVMSTRDEPPGSAEFSFKHEGGVMGEDCGGGDSWNCQSLEGSNLANKGDGRDSMNTPPVRERVMPNVFETVFCGGIQIKEEPATPQTVFESPERLTLPSGSNNLSPRTFDPSTRSMSEVDKGLNHSITSKISEHILEGRPFQYCGVCLNRSNEKVCFWDEKDLIEHCLLRHTDNHQNLRGSTSNNSTFPFSPWYQGRPVPSTSASGEPLNSPPSRTLPRPHSECGPQDVVSLSLSKVPPERRTAAKDKLLELLLLFEKDLHPAKVKLVPCESY